MTCKAVLVHALCGILATVAASTSCANIGAEALTAHTAPDEAEHCLASKDAVALLQTRPRMISAAATSVKAAEVGATDEKGLEEEEEVGEELEEDDHEEESVEADNRQDADGCTWTSRRRGSSPMKKNSRSACESACQRDNNCFGFTTARRRLSSALIETRRPPTELQTSSEQTVQGQRRRRCDFKRGTSCLARCSMPVDKNCDGYASAFSGTECKPGCRVEGYSPSIDAPTSLKCTNGVFDSPTDYACLLDAVSGTLTVEVVKATNVDDEDWTAGASDPYVMVYHNGQEERTRTVENSNDPQWNETFEFKNPNRRKWLTLTVYDEDDAALDDGLGSAEFDLRELIEKGGTRTYERNLNGSGKLNVKLSFKP